MNRCRSSEKADPRSGVALNSTRTSAPATCLSVPANLADWVEPGLLVVWIGQEVDRLPVGEKQKKALSGGTGDNGPSLLPLLSYAYATRVFNTQEIVHSCRTDPLFRFLCEARVPFPQEIIHFRRAHREPLQTVLAGLFRRAVASRFELHDSLFPEEIERDFRARSAERIVIARHLDTADD